MNLDQLRVALEEAGFRTGPDPMLRHPWIAYRRTDDSVRRCECNDSKRGVQVVVTPSEFAHDGNVWRSAEVDITGEAGGRWYRLSCYSLKPEELADGLPEVEAALVRAWQALDPRPHPPHRGRRP